MEKQRSNLKKDRISGKNEIFIEGKLIGFLFKNDKINYGKIKSCWNLTGDEFIKLGEMINAKN